MKRSMQPAISSWTRLSNASLTPSENERPYKAICRNFVESLVNYVKTSSTTLSGRSMFDVLNLRMHSTNKVDAANVLFQENANAKRSYARLCEMHYILDAIFLIGCFCQLITISSKLMVSIQKYFCQKIFNNNKNG